MSPTGHLRIKFIYSTASKSQKGRGYKVLKVIIMRLLIKLRSLKDAAYDLKYYNKLRGFLYGLQKTSKYFNRHDNTGYKLYSFSNLLPPKHMKEGDIRTLIISSPDSDFIKWLYGQFSLMSHSPKPINIGEMQFEIESVSFLKTFIDSGSAIITGTPIVIRIPKERYASISVVPEEYVEGKKISKFKYDESRKVTIAAIPYSSKEGLQFSDLNENMSVYFDNII